MSNCTHLDDLTRLQPPRLVCSFKCFRMSQEAPLATGNREDRQAPPQPCSFWDLCFALLICVNNSLSLCTGRSVRNVLIIRCVSLQSYSHPNCECQTRQDTPSGIDVCLSCFNGGCLDNERHHARTHVKKSGHTFTLNIKRKLRPSSQRVSISNSSISFTSNTIIYRVKVTPSRLPR